LDEGAEDKSLLDQGGDDYVIKKKDDDKLQDRSTDYPQDDVLSEETITKEEEKKEVNTSESESTPDHTLPSSQNPIGNGDQNGKYCEDATKQAPETIEKIETPVKETIATIYEGNAASETPISSTSYHKRIGSVHSTMSETSVSMVGSEDGIHDDETTRRK